MALTGQKVFVAGATGEVGRGAAYALSKAGADVFISGRNAEKLEALKNIIGSDSNVQVVQADYSTPQGASELDEKLGETKFDLVIVSSGPWWPVNKLSDADPEVFVKALQSNVTSQLLLFRTLAPRTKSSGQYLMINGTAALGLPNTGLTGICANAVVGIAKVANSECIGNEDLPTFAHVLISASVGHAQFRQETIVPNEFGKTFVAMALRKHTVDETGTILVDDTVYKNLAQQI